MKRHQFDLVVLGLYTFLSLWLTWPLAQKLTTYIPGEATWAFDEATFVWNMWWFKFSLLDLKQTPLESSYIFFPLGIKLTTYTFNLFNAAFGLPLQLSLSLPLANNLTLLFSYISSAYGAFLLSLYLLRHPTPLNLWLVAGQAKSQIVNPKSEILRWAAFAAGAVYAFSASRMMYIALGHYNFVTIQWFPFYTLFLLKTLRGGSAKTVFLAGLFAAFCLYAELTYSVFLLFITLLMLISEWRMGEWRMANERMAAKGDEQKDSARIIHHSSFFSPFFRLAVITLIAFILTSPFILAVLPDFLDPAYAEPGWGEGLKLSADLVGLVTLTPLHPLSGLDWQAELRAVVEGNSQFNDANTLFLGYGILVVALLGFLAYRRIAQVWLWGIVIFSLLSLGPLLTINGQNRFNLDGLEVTFPLPFMLLHYLPILNANRVPNRFGIPLTLALSVLAGYGSAWLLTSVTYYVSGIRVSGVRCQVSGVKYHGSSIMGHAAGGGSHPPHITHYVLRITHYTLRFTFYVLLLALLLFDQYSVPLPLSDARIPEVYRQIGAEPGNFTLMQLPLGWRNSYGTLGAEQTQLQYYQSAHQRPMLGGNTSRNPSFKFDYYVNIPLFAAITEAELYRSVDKVTLERARQQAAELMTLYNIKYLVVHEPIPFRKPYEDTFLTTQNITLELIPHQSMPVYQSPGVQVFAVQQADVPNPMTIDFGHWSGDPYRGEGWAGNEEIYAATANWATNAEAVLFFPVRGRGDRQLLLQVAPFGYPGMPEQQVHLVLNGQLLSDSFLLHEGWQVIEAQLPEAQLRPGLNRLTLLFAQTAQPRQVLPVNRTIGSTGLETPVDIELNSAADFAFITVGFGDTAVDASAHRRGVNLAVVQPQSGGEVITYRGFDTAANESEAAALTKFIAEIPGGQIVLIATQGLDAAAFFNADTSAAFESVGLSPEALTPPFSAIGVKGAAAGTALQVSGAETAYLRLGPSSDTRNLAAAVDKVIIE